VKFEAAAASLVSPPCRHLRRPLGSSAKGREALPRLSAGPIRMGRRAGGCDGPCRFNALSISVRPWAGAYAFD